eukprot:344868_1
MEDDASTLLLQTVWSVLIEYMTMSSWLNVLESGLIIDNDWKYAKYTEKYYKQNLSKHYLSKYDITDRLAICLRKCSESGISRSSWSGGLQPKILDTTLLLNDNDNYSFDILCEYMVQRHGSYIRAQDDIIKKVTITSKDLSKFSSWNTKIVEDNCFVINARMEKQNVLGFLKQFVFMDDIVNIKQIAVIQGAQGFAVCNWCIAQIDTNNTDINGEIFFLIKAQYDDLG